MKSIRSIPGSLVLVALTSLACFSSGIPLHASQPMIEETGSTPPAADTILPQLISQAAALYPKEHAREDTEPVVVSFTVDDEGRVKDAKVLSTPATQLETPAKKAVLAWKFLPGTRSGKPASFRLKAPVTFSVAKEALDDAPAANRKVAAVYPYDQLIKGQTGWGEVSFVVDYSGRAILAAPTGASDSSFARSVIAMVEATQFAPARKGKRTVLAASTDREFFNPEAALDPVARDVLAELRKPAPAIFQVADLDDRPKPLVQQSAIYPRSMKSDGLTGHAEIEFIVDRDGRVLFPRILSASHEDFGWSAATAVARWKFNPPIRNGRRVDVRMTVPILFDAQQLVSSD